MKRYIKFACLFLFVFFLISVSRAETMASQKTEKVGDVLSGKVEEGVRVIEMTASRYKFEPDPIVVKLGEKVRLIATSKDVEHGYYLPEFKVNLIIKPRESSQIEFVADKEGTFTAHCSVYCGPGHEHMEGTFKVTP